MPLATLQISPLTEQVRLARLVAGAAARRCGVNEDVLDEVRLAVGEACARAVIRQKAVSDMADVNILMEDTDTNFRVSVRDDAPENSGEPDDLAIAIISSLAPESSVETTDSGSIVNMVWPIVSVS